MVVDMEMQEAKDYVLGLMKDKEKIELEAKVCRDILDSNHVGMYEPLVDDQQYPREDIDVYQVRHARHKLICLKNDHIAVMKKIEEGLHRIHSLSGDQEPGPAPVATTSEDQESIHLEPFLRVNVVSPDSPAALAGIQAGDLILEFGSIDYLNFKSLNDIGMLVQNSRYKTVNIKIKRGSNIMALSLIPRPWVGNGLLGCNIMIVEAVER